MLTPHCSAASGMVAPPSIASTTRLRKSSEYGFAIHAGLLPVGSLNHIRARMGIPDSAFSGNALAGIVKGCGRSVLARRFLRNGDAQEGSELTLVRTARRDMRSV